MKKAVFYLFLLAALGLCSCLPMKVATSMHFESTRTFSADEVTVYSNGEPAPESATVLGEILVYDPDFTKTEPYETTMQTLKESVAENGGNAFYELEHREPSFWGSSNHQFSGHILLVEDTTINRENNRFSNEWAYQQKKIQENAAGLPKGHSAYVTTGVAFGIDGNPIACRDFKVGEQNSGYFKYGFHYSVGYEYVLPHSSLLVGLNNINFYGSANVGNIPIGLDLHSFNPHLGLVYSDKREIMKCRAGIGYGFLKDRNGTLNLNEGVSNSNYVNGWSIMYDIVAMYRLNDKFGLGINCGGFGWQGSHGAPSMRADINYMFLGLIADFRF